MEDNVVVMKSRAHGFSETTPSAASLEEAVGNEGRNNVIQLTKDQLSRVLHTQKLMNKKVKHEQRIGKKREERWQQPFADAKIEDVKGVFDYTQNLQFKLELLTNVLKEKGVITDADLVAAEKYQEDRLAAFRKLTSDTTLTEEDKRAEAAKWNLPLNLLGLKEETPTTEGDEPNIRPTAGEAEPGL